MKLEKIIFLLIIVFASLGLFIYNFADGANVFPAWIMAYSQWFFYIWLVATILSLFGLFN